MSEEIITIGKGDLKVSVSVSDGQVVSINKNEHEYIHGGALPEKLKRREDKNGWQRSDLEMFPVVGPVYDLCINSGNTLYPMGQHGIIRTLRPLRGEFSDYNAAFHYEYNGEDVDNIKGKDPARINFQPFRFSKFIDTKNKKVEQLFTIKNLSNEDMRYNFGLHPAFKLEGSIDDWKLSIPGENVFQLETILDDIKKNDTVFLKNNKNLILYNNNIQKSVTLDFDDFNHSMLWTKDPHNPTFLCMEPVRHLPELIKGVQRYFLDSNNKNPYAFDTLKPQEERTYSMLINPL